MSLIPDSDPAEDRQLAPPGGSSVGRSMVGALVVAETARDTVVRIQGRGKKTQMPGGRNAATADCKAARSPESARFRSSGVAATATPGPDHREC